ncbi:MAG: CheR family methyltransferase [Candidatus Dormibacteria bacterium]
MALPVDAALPDLGRAAPDARELERIEVDLLLEGVHQHYGFDFRKYAAAPLRRGIRNAMSAEGVATVSGLQERVLHEPASMHRFLGCVGVHVTALFREPPMFAALLTEVFPLLRTYPSVRIWIAGCATGEEAYSLAVLLDQAEILGRCRIYATDMNAEALQQGRRGTYPALSVESAQVRFTESGGAGDLESYARRSSRAATFAARLRSHVTWAEHNLVSDASFNEFHLVICSNVLIYFDRQLQVQVHRLLDESVVAGGFLAVSCRETLGGSLVKGSYRRVTPLASVFQKVRT